MRIQALLTAAAINLKRPAAALIAIRGLVWGFLSGCFFQSTTARPRSPIVTSVAV
jgi:hypothetical protein